MKRLVISSLACVAFASGSAFAADMPVKAPPMVAATVFSWTGFYVGMEAGYGQANTNSVRNVANSQFPVGFGSSITTKGVLGGFDAGANYQYNWLVIGIDGDFQGSTVKGSSNDFSPIVAGNHSLIQRETDWLATITGRLGLAYDRWMIYGRGGAAWRGVDTAASNTTLSGAGAVLAVSQVMSATQTGYVAGGGVEWAPVDFLSFKVEYDYYNFGSQASAGSVCFAGGCGGVGAVTLPGETTGTPTMWQLKAAATLHFNWTPSGPVMAKY